jgi:hypothetical protein
VSRLKRKKKSSVRTQVIEVVELGWHFFLPSSPCLPALKERGTEANTARLLIVALILFFFAQVLFMGTALAKHKTTSQEQPVMRQSRHSKRLVAQPSQSSKTSEAHRKHAHLGSQAVVALRTSAEESRHGRRKHGKNKIESKKASKVVEKSAPVKAKEPDDKPEVSEAEEQVVQHAGENERLARAYNLYDSGANLRLLGNYEQAISRLMEARQLFHMSGQAQVFESENGSDGPPANRSRAGAPMEALATFELAQAAEAARNDALAERTYRDCISLNPKFLPAYQKLSCITARQGKTEEALGIARQALSLAPSDAQTHSIISHLLSELGQTAEARSEKERAASLLQNNRAFNQPGNNN